MIASPPAISINTIPSAGVTAGAVRLILGGYLAKVHYGGREDGHLFWTIPSESGRGLYQITYSSHDKTLACTCKAGQNGMACKHLRLVQLMNGWAAEGPQS